MDEKSKEALLRHSSVLEADKAWAITNFPTWKVVEVDRYWGMDKGSIVMLGSWTSLQIGGEYSSEFFIVEKIEKHVNESGAESRLWFTISNIDDPGTMYLIDGWDLKKLNVSTIQLAALKVRARKARYGE